MLPSINLLACNVRACMYNAQLLQYFRNVISLSQSWHFIPSGLMNLYQSQLGFEDRFTATINK